MKNWLASCTACAAQAETVILAMKVHPGNSLHTLAYTVVEIIKVSRCITCSSTAAWTCRMLTSGRF